MKGRAFVDVRWRRPAFEVLEDRTMLSIAQDLVDQLAPYQAALNTALSASTNLPLVGSQLKSLQEFTTLFQNSLQSIENQTQNIASSGHYEVVVALPSYAKTFTFDLGLDAFLQVTAAGGVSVAINPVLTVAFDYQNGMAALDSLSTRLDIGFNVSLPGFQATASLNGFLFTKAVDTGTSFQGNLGFDFTASDGLINYFSGEAHVRMGLTLSFADPALNASFNPKFHTDFVLDWGIDTQTNQLLAPNITLLNFGLEADSFLQGFMGDVVKSVQKFTKPMQSFIDVFQTPVPILSAFDSSETIGTLMLKGSNVSQEQQDRFGVMIQIISAVNSINLSGAGGAVIPFGTITISGDAQQSGAFGFDTSQLTTAIDDIVNSPALQAVEDAIKSVGNYAGLSSESGFKFPLLENPGPVVGAILTGQIETMFSFSIGRQHFELAPSIGVGIKDLFGVFLTAGIIFDANLTMGYDTAGLIAYTQNPSDPAKLLHGFYFDNSIDATAPPIPNHPPVRQTGLYLQGLMEVSASAGATVSGGLYANVNVELVNTDDSSHVHLDTMLGNFASGAKVFNLSGKIYASADLSFQIPTPIGPDITLFSFNLGYEELLNFDPPPPPDLGLPVTVIDVVDQHTLLLDVNKIGVGSRIVSVQPFHNLSVTVNGGTVEADGIRVDYPNEIYLYVQRKNDLTTNYFNLIGLNGAVPDGVSINIADPFRVFVDEGAPSPLPTQTKPGILLVGGRNVIYNFTELADGTKPNVLMVGGYGSNTLTGGTMSFGNFIPGDRLAQAKAHFGNASGFDGAGQGLIDSAIDAAIAPANPAGIIGAKITGRRGGLMYGGPGNNTFIATGAGVYDMIGGAWLNSFDISPSFFGAAATYQIDGGPFGQSQLIVRVPPGEIADFENGALPDKYNPTFKALDVFANAGLSATAHGVQSVVVIGAPGSTIIIGDTSELDIDFNIRGSGTVKFGGSPAPDVLDVTTRYPVDGFYAYGAKNHRTSAALLPHPWVANPVFSDEMEDFLIAYPGWEYVQDYPIAGYSYIYVDGPFYSISRTFGTNNRTQVIEWNISEVDSSSMVLDGRGASDQYRISLGLGAFLDITVDDTDETSQNSLVVDFRQQGFMNHRATLSDSALHLEYYVPIQIIDTSLYPRVWYFSSVTYSPTVYFDANTDITFATAEAFLETNVSRPTAPQIATILIDAEFTGSVAIFPAAAYAWDPDEPNPQLIPFPWLANRTLNVQSNAGNLSVERIQPLPLVANRTGLDINVYANNGTLTLSDSQVWLGYHDTYTVHGNSGTLNVITEITESGGGQPFIYELTRLVDVLANSGVINFHTTINPAIYNYGYDTLVNLGDNGDLTGVQGTINFSNTSNGRFGLRVDGSNGSPSTWAIDSDKTVVGGLVLNYGDANEPFDGYSFFEIFAAPQSTFTLFELPPFYRRRLNDEPYEFLRIFGAPAAMLSRPNDVVNIQLTTDNESPDPVEFSAVDLPPGLSIDPATGLVSGSIDPLAYLAGSYATVVRATQGNLTRAVRIDWRVSEITITAPNTRMDRVGDVVSLPIQATTISGSPVVFGAQNLPVGLSIDAMTGVISGTVGGALSGAEQLTSMVTATNGNDMLSHPIEWLVVPAGQSNDIRFQYVGNQTNREFNYAFVELDVTSTLDLPLSYVAQGLPPGVQLYYEEFDDYYYLAGSIQAGAASSSPYHATVTATDGFWSGDASFDWFVYGATSVNVVNPGNQFNIINDPVELAIVAGSSLSQPLAFSATGLPDGLSINPQTGVISGTISPLATLPSLFEVQVTATDGTSVHGATFTWKVASSALPNVVSLPKPGGGTIDLTLSAGSFVTASISTDPGVALPAGISFPLGFLDFTIIGLSLGEAITVTIAGVDVAQFADYYKYGATPANGSDHWYNFLFGQQTDGDSPIGTGMEIVGGNIVLHLIDGSRGDDDTTMNGVIADIGGPALSVVNPNPLPGDYNRNNVVDAADYTVWRNSLHASVEPFTGADGNGDGTVDVLDYHYWKSRYGNMLIGSGASAELPAEPELPTEPASVSAEALSTLSTEAPSQVPLRSESPSEPPTLNDPLTARDLALRGWLEPLAGQVRLGSRPKSVHVWLASSTRDDRLPRTNWIDLLDGRLAALEDFLGPSDDLKLGDDRPGNVASGNETMFAAIAEGMLPGRFATDWSRF